MTKKRGGGDRVSSVGISTSYGLGVWGFEPLRGARFFGPIQTGPEDKPLSCTLGPGCKVPSSVGVAHGYSYISTSPPYILVMLSAFTLLTNMGEVHLCGLSVYSTKPAGVKRTSEPSDTFHYCFLTTVAFDALLTVHLGIILVNNQLDAQLFFLICLFQFSTCFERHSAHHQENKLYQYNILYMSHCVGDRRSPTQCDIYKMLY